jgi:hypothetical protein
MISAISAFQWSVSVTIIVVAAMYFFREPISDFISRSHELKAGRFLSLKAKRPDVKIMEQVLESVKAAAQAAEGELDTQRLVIRDSKDLPRIIVSTAPSGDPFLALFDEEGEVRVSLSASSTRDPNGVAMPIFRGKGRGPEEIASLIGAELDGSGTVGVRNSLGEWQEVC